MATIIKIKNSGLSGAPSTLATGELAYSYLTQLPIEGLVSTTGGDRLYVGTGTEVDGEATDIVHVGGKYYMDMLDHENGIVNPNSAIITDSNSRINILEVDNIKLDLNTISATNTSGDLHLDTKDSASIIYLDSETHVGTINVDTIGSTNIDGNVYIEPAGTGYLEISSQNAVRIPVGNTSTRDPSPLQGMIRYNTNNKWFEGYDGTDWVSLNQLVDSDSSGANTKITAENATGVDNNQLRFYTDGVERMRVEDTGEVKFSDELTAVSPIGIQIKNNTISTFGTDILYLDPSTGGSNTGSVVIEGNLTIKGVTTTSNSASAQSEDTTIILGFSSDSEGVEIPLVANDGLDKGIEFRWFDTSAKSGFFGYDSSEKRFTFIEDATNTSNTFSGAASNVAFGNALLDSITFTPLNYTDNAVTWVDTSGDVQFAGGDSLNIYNGGDTTGQVLQMNASGIPVFAHIDCGTY